MRDGTKRFGARRSTPAALVIALGVLTLSACSSSSTASSRVSTTASATVLAPAGDKALSGPVDGITCSSTEQLVFHIHVHLAIYVDGQQRLLPPGVGIGPPLQFQQTSSGPFVVGGSCFSWLHTHDSSGVIHIESPVQRVYTLGNFFDIWGQPLSATQVGPATGTVSATVNGQPFTGNPRNIPLNAHNVIQLDVGSTSPSPHPYQFPSGL